MFGPERAQGRRVAGGLAPTLICGVWWAPDPSHALPADEVLTHAADVLYASKRSGRDRVTWASPAAPTLPA